jgi:hypothetical protein
MNGRISRCWRQRVARVGMIAWGTVLAWVMLFLIPQWLPRPFLSLGDARHAPFSFRADGERVGVSWYPAGGRRAPWAGQINRWGVRYNVYTFDGSDVSVPTWYVAVLAGVGVLVSIWLRKRNAGPRLGHCRVCGYNLARNVSGVCPECGAPVSSR